MGNGNENENKLNLSKVQKNMNVSTARTNVSTGLKTAVVEMDLGSCEVPYTKVIVEYEINGQCRIVYFV